MPSRPAEIVASTISSADEARANGGRAERGRSRGPARDGNRLQAGVGVGEPVLERLRAAEEAVLAHAVVECGADRVREQHEADRLVAAHRVAPRLVVRLDVAEAQAVPGGARPAVELEEPEPEPSARERAGGELAVERLSPAAERRRASAPDRAVKREQRVEVRVQVRRVVGEPVVELVLPFEPTLPAAHLLAEVRAARGEVLLPAA